MRLSRISWYSGLTSPIFLASQKKLVTRFPKGILFDFDGTLVNSEIFHFRVLRDLFKQDFGVEIDLDYYNLKLAGIPLSHSSPGFIAEHNLSIKPEYIVQAFDEHTGLKLQQEEVPLMPHALQAIEFFQDRGCKLGIVTGSGRRDVTLTLGRLGLMEKFTTLITNDEVQNVKPHPEPYLKGVEALGLAKEHIVSFEDSPNGMTSATAAGLYCVGIQREPILSKRMNHGSMLFQGFDEVINHFEGIEG